MTAPIFFNRQAAQEALARSDDGLKALPGDPELIAAYESYCQQEQDRFQAQCDAQDLADWLSTQCAACVEGGTGKPCDECAVELVEVAA